MVRARPQGPSALKRTPPLRLPQPSGGRESPRRMRKGVKPRELQRSRKEEQRRVCSAQFAKVYNVCVSTEVCVVCSESTDGGVKASSSKVTDWESIKWNELGQTKDAR